MESELNDKFDDEIADIAENTKRTYDITIIKLKKSE